MGARWANTDVVVKVGGGEATTVSAVARAGLAVHRAVGGGACWTITHVPSGLAVVHVATKGNAMRLAGYLLRLAERDRWSWELEDGNNVVDELGRSLSCSPSRVRSTLVEAAANPTAFARRYGLLGRSRRRPRTYRRGGLRVSLWREGNWDWVRCRVESVDGARAYDAYLPTAQACLRAVKAMWRSGRVLRYVYDRRTDSYMVYARKQWVAVVPANISARRLRTAALMAAAQMRRRRPVSMKDPGTGELVGWRLFLVDDRTGTLRSPYMGTVWHEPELRAATWSRHDAVRGHAGIHAWWPAADGGPPAAALVEWVWQLGLVLAEVRGSGRYVAGTDGWRAEVVRVVRVVVSPEELPVVVMATEKESWHGVEVCLATPRRV